MLPMKTTERGKARRARLTAALAAVMLAVVAPGVAAQQPFLVPGAARALAEGVHIIPDRGANLVPNIGILIGSHAVMVIDTGLGPRNGDIVIAEVARLTTMPVTHLTTTHYHAEHASGAQSFPASVVVITPRAQRDELRDKGEAFIERFKNMFGDDMRDLLDPVIPRYPDIVFDGAAEIDLGGLMVRLIHVGPAHTLGDTVYYLPAQKILFAGGLAPNRQFPIMPDADADGDNWIARLTALQSLDIDIVVPGHGDTGGPELLATTRAYLEDVRAQVRAHKARGATEDATVATLGPRVEAQHPGWSEPFWIANTIRNFYASDREAP